MYIVTSEQSCDYLIAGIAGFSDIAQIITSGTYKEVGGRVGGWEGWEVVKGGWG